MAELKTLATVRERERERELYFNKPKYGFVKQPDTHTGKFIEQIKGKKAFVYHIKMADYILESSI